jgi:DNA-binding NarL/FixJ family response regulator
VALSPRYRGTLGAVALAPPLRGRERELSRIRVLLADDHEDFLAVALRLLEPRFEVVKSVSDGQAVIDEASALDPDVLVLDISMPIVNGLEAARQLRATGFTGKIIFLTVHADADYVRAAVAAGAFGYVVKSRLASDLPLALNEVVAGRQFFSPVT